MIRSLISFLLLLALTGSALSGCKKAQDSNVPMTSVDIYIYTSTPSFINLNAVGGWVYVTGGVKGILVYRRSSSEFMAYERNCTYQPSNPCSLITVDPSNIMAIDTCCNSQFALYDGAVLHSPATLPLKTYHTTFDGNVLHIYN